MSEWDKPRWLINKEKRDLEYRRLHSKKISITIYESDYRYLEIWKAIPCKTDWLKEKLEEYARENDLEV